jgi:hypothetical protein
MRRDKKLQKLKCKKHTRDKLGFEWKEKVKSYTTPMKSLIQKINQKVSGG